MFLNHADEGEITSDEKWAPIQEKVLTTMDRVLKAREFLIRVYTSSNFGRVCDGDKVSLGKDEKTFLLD